MNIVIIGGGFAGINLATELLNQKVSKLLLLIKTTIIFPPLIYQVATAFLLLALVILTVNFLLLVKKPSVSSWKVIESCAFRKKNHTS
jgi:NADH dehydrogenase FAD-containing subunit